MGMTVEQITYQKKYQKEHREQINKHLKIASKKYRQRNKRKVKAYYKKHRERYKTYFRKDNLLRNYKLTEEMYNTMLSNQLNLCALCHKDFEGKTPTVDHDHKTGVVRGLIHRKCNSLLGYAGDDISILQLGIDYLQKHQNKG
jgi:hypothetical protein